MDRSHPAYLAVAIIFALALQLVLMWRLRRSLAERTDHEPNDGRTDH